MRQIFLDLLLLWHSGNDHFESVTYPHSAVGLTEYEEFVSVEPTVEVAHRSLLGQSAVQVGGQRAGSSGPGP